MNVFQQHLSASFNVFHRNTHQSPKKPLVRPSQPRSLPQWLWDQRRNPSSGSPCRRNPRRHSPCRCNPNTARRGARSIPRSIGFLIAADATCGFFFRCCCELMYELAMDFHAWIFPQVQWICVWIYVAKNPRRHCAKKSTKNPRLIHATSGGPKQKIH